MEEYDDILYLPHYQSAKRRHMSLHERAAQFAPFAALKGYEEEVIETARLTQEQIILDENEIEGLDKKLQEVSRDIALEKMIAITYFEPDKLKSGGAYRQKIGIVKKIDAITNSIIFTDRSEIPIGFVYDIQTK